MARDAIFYCMSEPLCSYILAKTQLHLRTFAFICVHSRFLVLVLLLLSFKIPDNPTGAKIRSARATIAGWYQDIK